MAENIHYPAVYSDLSERLGILIKTILNFAYDIFLRMKHNREKTHQSYFNTILVFRL